MVDLLCELFEYYNHGQSVSREDVRQHLSENLSGENSTSKLLVAHTEKDDVMGFAAISFFHSLVDPRPQFNKQCLLKELYVRNAYRNLDIGAQIMPRVIQVAREAGCARIDWNVKTHNHSGIRFYKRFGAEHVEDRASYRIILLWVFEVPELRHRGQIGRD